MKNATSDLSSCILVTIFPKSVAIVTCNCHRTCISRQKQRTYHLNFYEEILWKKILFKRTLFYRFEEYIAISADPMHRILPAKKTPPVAFIGITIQCPRNFR